MKKKRDSQTDVVLLRCDRYNSVFLENWKPQNKVDKLRNTRLL